MWPIWCHFTLMFNLILWFRVDYMKSSCSSLSAKGGGDKNPEIPVSGSLTGIFVFNVWTNKPLRSTLSGGNSAPFPGLPPDEGSYSLIVCILHASILRVVT